MKALIIGGSKGIGSAILHAAVAEGADAWSMSRSETGLQRLDLAWVERGIHEAMQSMIQAIDGVDWLVISAGMGAYLAPWEMNDEKLLQMFQVNTLGRIQVYRACLRHLLKSRGRILFIGSTVANHGASGLSVYAGCHGYVNAFVRSESRELAKHGVFMNVLAPGWVETDMTAEINPKIRAKCEAWMPKGRFLTPEEVASKAIEILQSQRSGEIIEFLGD